MTHPTDYWDVFAGHFICPKGTQPTDLEVKLFKDDGARSRTVLPFDVSPLSPSGFWVDDGRLSFESSTGVYGRIDGPAATPRTPPGTPLQYDVYLSDVTGQCVYYAKGTAAWGTPTTIRGPSQAP